MIHNIHEYLYILLFTICLKYLSLCHFLMPLIICESSKAFQEHVHEKCILKSRSNDIQLSCELHERIAIKDAFFTTAKLRCPLLASSTMAQTFDSSQDYDSFSYIRTQRSCTDDLRLSINKLCSGFSNCSFNFFKDHISLCVELEGSIIIRYSCVAGEKYHPFCNLNLTSNYGYVSTPGYPDYYPPYDNCVWNIKGLDGQIVQIDILDAALKEPRNSHNNKIQRPDYLCSDKLVISEDNVNIYTKCGEHKLNLIQHRSKSNSLKVSFLSLQFSPTRGILFRYSLENCPTIAAPKRAHMTRNGSFAYYTCCEDYVFEDSQQNELVLYCEHGNQWNSSVPKCVSKQSLIVTSFSRQNESHSLLVRAQHEEKEETYIYDILVPVVLMIGLLLGNAVIVWILFRLKRKQKSKSKHISSSQDSQPFYKTTNV